MADSSTKEKRSFSFLVWISLGLLVVCFFLFATANNRYWQRHWPPNWMERRTQREFVFTNIEAQGGWNEFKSECDFLISWSQTNEQHQWFTGFGDKFDKFPEPCKIFSRLNPGEVDAYVSGNKPAYVVVYVFGLHRTGGHDTPAYYLVYQQLTNSDECVAGDLFFGSKLTPRKLADSIFEYY